MTGTLFDADEKSQPSDPHFDDDTIATAQPVEPLVKVEISTWRRRFATLRWYLSSTPAVIAAVVMSTIAMLSLGMAGLHQRVRVMEADAAIKPSEQPIQSEVAAGGAATALKQETPPQSAKPRRIRMNVVNSPSKPVARKVGVIYGSSPDNR
jgi:hypothetical protein